MLEIRMDGDNRWMIGGVFPPLAGSLLIEKKIWEYPLLFGPYSVHTALGTRPYSPGYHFDDVIYGRSPKGAVTSKLSDYVQTQNYLHTGWSFFSGNWQFGGRAVQNEHPVSHANLVGAVSTQGQVDYPYAGAEGSELDRTFTTAFRILADGDQGEFNSILPTELVTNTFEPDLLTPSEHKAYLQANSYYESPLWQFGVAGHEKIGPLVYNAAHSVNAFSSKYVLYTVLRSGSIYYHGVIVRNESFWIEFQPGPYNTGVDYNVNDVFKIRHVLVYKANYVQSSSPNGTVGYTPAMQALYNGASLTLGYPVLSGGIVAVDRYCEPWLATAVDVYAAHHFVGYEGSKFYLTHDKTFRAFEQFVSANARDMYPLGVVAARDAVDEAAVALGINQLESSQDFWGLLTIVDIVQLLAAAKTLKIDQDFIWNVLDVLTNARLMYSYAVSPTVDDYQTIVDKAMELKDAWRRFTHPSTIVGSVRFTPSDKFSDMDVSILVRATIRLGIQPDALLSVLPVYAAGFLPTLSTLWENIPFSFLADKLFPTGKLLDSFDSTYLLQAFNVEYCTLTYKLECAVPNSVLGDSNVVPGISGSGNLDSGIKYRHFDRCVLTHIPYLSPSRYLEEELFSGVLTNIDWVTTGSLFYQLLKR